MDRGDHRKPLRRHTLLGVLTNGTKQLIFIGVFTLVPFFVVMSFMVGPSLALISFGSSFAVVTFILGLFLLANRIWPDEEES